MLLTRIPRFLANKRVSVNLRSLKVYHNKFQNWQMGGFRCSFHTDSHEDIIEECNSKFKSVRGKPELLDRLEDLVHQHPGIETNTSLYQTLYPFILDNFQSDCIKELIAGKNVILSTPTGSGKTLVGELAIYYALMRGLRVVYTAPLKALSNQKYQDFRDRFGGDRVGLLTGDISINPTASVVVMTTEVFRNMVYENQHQLENLFMVCFDEFHFMNDPDRGTVWEESVISCPKDVRILALSATMGNVKDIKGWMESIHGPTSLVLSQFRPVPLQYHYATTEGLMQFFQDKNAGPGGSVSLLAEKKSATVVVSNNSKNNNKSGAWAINKDIIALTSSKKYIDLIDEGEWTDSGGGMKGKKKSFNNKDKSSKKQPNKQQLSGSSGGGSVTPRYSEIVMELHKTQKLPAIVFIFSRTGCDEAARAVAQNCGSTLLSRSESKCITQALDAFTMEHPDIPLPKGISHMLRAGVGVHHAGLIGVWKSLIEDLFNANKLKVLFATETLAAGVNMPARTTVISTVTKKIDGEVVKLKTSQLLQMAGRAGRRGKDKEGSVVLVRNHFEEVTVGHQILTSPIDSVQSHFRSSYATAVKMLDRHSLAECQELVEKSFGTYITQDRAKKRLERQAAKHIKVKGITADTTDPTSQIASVAQHRDILTKYTLKGARNYLKLIKNRDKEARSLEFLLAEQEIMNAEAVESVIDYLSIGTALSLTDGREVYFLGPVSNSNDVESDTDAVQWYYAIDRSGVLYKLNKEHVRSIPDPDTATLSIRHSQHLVKQLAHVTEWTESIGDRHSGDGSGDSLDNVSTSDYFTTIITAPSAVESALKALLSLEPVTTKTAVATAASSDLLPVDESQSAEVRRQLKVIAEIDSKIASHPIKIYGDEGKVLSALNYLAELNDPSDFLSTIDNKSSGKASSKISNKLKQIQEKNNDNLLEDDLADNQSHIDVNHEAPNFDYVEESVAWTRFQNVVQCLEEFAAFQHKLVEEDSENFDVNSTAVLTVDNTAVSDNYGDTESETSVTAKYVREVSPLGQLIASLTSDNELWTALVVSHSNVQDLNPAELAAVIAATVVEKDRKMESVYVRYAASDVVQISSSLCLSLGLFWFGESHRVLLSTASYATFMNKCFDGILHPQDVFKSLKKLRSQLEQQQEESEVDFPINLTQEIAGLVESWVHGVTWRQLCKETNLDQGDTCRLLRRTVELLRQLSRCADKGLVSEQVAQTALQAADIMDRYPVADTTFCQEERPYVVDHITGLPIPSGIPSGDVDVSQLGGEFEAKEGDGGDVSLQDTNHSEDESEVLRDIYELIEDREEMDQQQRQKQQQKRQKKKKGSRKRGEGWDY